MSEINTFTKKGLNFRLGCKCENSTGYMVKKNIERRNSRNKLETTAEGILFNSLNAELNPICYLLALLGAHHFLHVSRIRVKSLILRLLMLYIYGASILDVSRSHTTTHHSR